MRYTECRLSPLAVEMLRDIDAETVDFMPNYDERRREPIVLPARFPNLLVNGSSGIAVGMATNIPPHNLGETIDAVVELIDNPDATHRGPDGPHQGPGLPDRWHRSWASSGIREAYETGPRPRRDAGDACTPRTSAGRQDRADRHPAARTWSRRAATTA